MVRHAELRNNAPCTEDRGAFLMPSRMPKVPITGGGGGETFLPKLPITHEQKLPSARCFLGPSAAKTKWEREKAHESRHARPAER
jgi:hypothetical protein